MLPKMLSPFLIVLFSMYNYAVMPLTGVINCVFFIYNG